MFKLGIIGLDTSHTVKFAQLIQGEHRIVHSLKITGALRFPSPFQNEEGQDERQQQLEELGIKVSTEFEEAVDGVDGILLEINDPALHLKYFKMAAELGVPVFIDKPFADNLVNATEIVDIAKAKNISIWTSSSLRFTPEIKKCAEDMTSLKTVNIYGPLGSAPAGSSVIWYGIHSFEMLATLAGTKADKIQAVKDECGIVAVIYYKDGRRGVVECNSGIYHYGGRALNEETSHSFLVDFSSSDELYGNLIGAIENFFIDGTIPVSLEDSLTIQAMLDATEKSIASGNAEKIVSI